MFATGPRKVRCASCREVWLASDGAAPRPPAVDPVHLAEQLATEPPPPPGPPEAAQPDFDSIDIDPPAPVPQAVAPVPSAAIVAEPPAAAGELPVPVTAPSLAAPAGEPPEDDLARRREQRRKNRAAAPVSGAASPRRQPAAFAVVLAAASLGTLFTLVVMRHETVRVMPQTALIFEAVGLPVTRHAFDIADIKSRLIREENRETLEVTGMLHNLSKERQRVPVLRIALQNGGGQDIYVWTATADVPELGPGEKTAFRRRLASPPAEAQTVLVRFLAIDDIVAAIR